MKTRTPVRRRVVSLMEQRTNARIQELTDSGELEETVVQNMARLIREKATASDQTIIDYAAKDLLPSLAVDPVALRLFLRAFAIIVRDECSGGAR